MGRKGDEWHCECHDGFEGDACEHELESHCGDDIDNDGGMSSLYQLSTTCSKPNLRLDWMGTVLVNIYVYICFANLLDNQFTDMQEKVKARLRESRLLAPSGRARGEFTQPGVCLNLQICTNSPYTCEIK